MPQSPALSHLGNNFEGRNEMTKRAGRVQEGPVVLVLWQLVGSSPGLCAMQGGQGVGCELGDRWAAESHQAG